MPGTWAAEADRLVDTLRTTRLTVLTGAAGSGKTRRLREGVLPRLRRRSDDEAAAARAPDKLSPTERRRGSVRPRELFVWCDHWDGSPAENVHACLDALTGATSGRPRPPLALRAKAIGAERAARLLFVFDHGDRIAAETAAAAEYDALVNALCSVAPSVHLLLSARDGALPPSVQSRLGSPDTRALRLPDPASFASAAAAEAAGGPSVETGRALHRDGVHAPIAERLRTIDGRSDAPAWGAAARLPAPVPADAPPVGRGGETTGPAVAEVTAAPRFAPGSFAGVSARRARVARRARGAAFGIVVVAVVGVGTALWPEREDPGPRGRPADDRVEAANPAVPAPSAPASTDRPIDLAAVEPGAESPLADDLWREMSRQGVAWPAVDAAADPAEALAAAGRIAVVPYDALRGLAAARGGARIVAPLFTEELHVVVRSESPLTSIDQIAGRRIDVGPAQSSRRLTAIAFLQRLFGRPLDADETRGEGLAEALADLLGGSIDAIVVPEPQPSAWLTTLPAAQRARLRLLGAAPGDPSTRRALRGYLPASLPPPTAAGGPAVETFAVMTFLVASPATPVGRDDTAAVAAKAFCGALPALRRDGHPKWREVDATLRLPAPLPYDAGAAAAMRACDVAARPPSAP